LDSCHNEKDCWFSDEGVAACHRHRSRLVLQLIAELLHLQAAYCVSGFYGVNDMGADGPRPCVTFHATSFIPISNVASASQVEGRSQPGAYNIALRFCRQILAQMPLSNDMGISLGCCWLWYSCRGSGNDAHVVTLQFKSTTHANAKMRSSGGSSTWLML
jgi:hypothetical protein